MTSEEARFWLPVIACMLTIGALFVTYVLWTQPPHDD